MRETPRQESLSPPTAQALLERIPGWPDKLQDQFTFTTAADLQHHEIIQYWKHEALRYCAALTVTDPQPPLCQKIRPLIPTRLPAKSPLDTSKATQRDDAD